jgi:hypothetical protein
MFKNIFTAVLFITLLTTVLSGAIPIRSHSAVKEDIEYEIIKVVKGAVEDTNWLQVSSKQEMQQMMEAYYTGDLLTEVSDNGWRFVSRPNSWEYVVSTGSIDVEVISAKEGAAHVEILEKDEISGCVYSSIVNYFLIKNDNGWKIKTRTVCIP